MTQGILEPLQGGNQKSAKKVFCTFADSRNRWSLRRIRRQAKRLRFFDRIVAHDEGGLDPDFRARYGNMLKPEVKGFGYWVWKPQVIRQTLALADDGDLLLYADAGCHLRLRGLERLEAYFERLAHSPNFIMATELAPGYIEKKWTKGDLFDYFGCRIDPLVTGTPQIQATVIFVKKTPEAEQFFDDWSRVYEEDFTLADDTPSRAPNFREFLEHRHDQSIFSVMCKLTGADLIPNTEIYRFANWVELDDYPIWAMRDLSTKRTRKQRVKFWLRNKARDLFGV